MSYYNPERKSILYSHLRTEPKIALKVCSKCNFYLVRNYGNTKCDPIPISSD